MSRYDDTDGKVYVGNLDKDVTQEQLQTLFNKHGSVRTVWVARNPPGFAFVTFYNSQHADDAVRHLDGTSIKGKEIRVEIAKGPKGVRRAADGGGRYKGRDRDDGGRHGDNGGYWARKERYPAARSPSPGYRRSPCYRRSPSYNRSRSFSRDRDRKGRSRRHYRDSDYHRHKSESVSRSPYR